MSFFYTFAFVKYYTNNMASETIYRKELKGKILEEAMRQFFQYGIKKVKMDDIARALAISKRTLYEIYQDKEQLLYEGLQKTEEYIDTYLYDYAKDGCRNAVEILMESYYIQVDAFSHISPQFFIDIPKYKKVMEMLSSRRIKREKATLDFFQWGIDEGFFRAETDFKVVSMIGQNTMTFIIESGMYNETTFQTIFDNSFLIFIRGLCTEKGIRIVDEKSRKRH